MRISSISNQIIIISILPALVVATLLSTNYILDQLNFINDAINKNGQLIAKQLAPAAEYSIYSGNTEQLKPIVDTVINNNPVERIQIFDKYNNSILDVSNTQHETGRDSSILKGILAQQAQLKFLEPVISAQLALDNLENLEAQQADDKTDNQIGMVVVTLTTKYAVKEKIEKIENGLLITLSILMITILLVIRISGTITQPIKSLTKAVRDITIGNLDTRLKEDATGEIGILQSCINRMAKELKNSRSDMEIQLNIYTEELQQTLEELEIRNAELDITRSKAIYANNAKSEFLANMSHEIRTPLSGVIGFTELLQDTHLSNQQKDYTDTIQKSAKNLLEIINDILDLSKIESGKTEISTSEFNPVDIIEDIINLLTPTALEKNIELFYRIDRDVPTCISSDPYRMHQILTNLIGNAIKFTDEGYVYLQVTAGDIRGNEVNIKFTVSDTGIGMNGSDKKKLFNAFTQADTSITRRFGGTGLGLVISRKLTLLMHGEIGFDSTENEGSTFWFSVPVVVADNKPDKCEFTDKRIAFFCNHFIARQAYKTLFDVCQCQIQEFEIDRLDELASIEEGCDIIVVFLSRKEINDAQILKRLEKQAFNKPSMLVASTRSHSELRDLQQHTYDSAIFSSEKIALIKKKMANTINKNTLEADEAPADSDDRKPNDWSNINVMVVDDNEINLRLAEILLHKQKARVTTARSGAQAIDYASMNSFDIIFMDLHMPGIDGYETTEKIRTITPMKQPVIIALTANTLPQEEEKVKQSGMNGIIIKPVSEAILQKVIHQWILKDPINSFGNTGDQKMQKSDAIPQDDIFSLELAKQFTSNNEELAYELFAMLRSEITAYKEGITAALNDGDLEAMRLHVHKLHGASRCCGTTQLQQASDHVENLIVKKVEFDVEKEVALLLEAIERVEKFDIESTKTGT